MQEWRARWRESGANAVTKGGRTLTMGFFGGGALAVAFAAGFFFLPVVVIGACAWRRRVPWPCVRAGRRSLAPRRRSRRLSQAGGSDEAPRRPTDGAGLRLRRLRLRS